MKNSKRGKVVAFCGIDGCGKTTLIDEINNNNDKIVRKHPPQEWFDNPRVIAAFLDCIDEDAMTTDEEIDYIYNLDRSKEAEIIKMTDMGKDVLFHRYIFSLFAYHIGTKAHTMEELLKYFGPMLLPDEVIYLKISKEVFYERIKNKKNPLYLYDDEYIKRVFDCYDYLADLYNWKVIENDTIGISKAVDLAKQILREVPESPERLNLNREPYQAYEKYSKRLV